MTLGVEGGLGAGQDRPRQGSVAPSARIQRQRSACPLFSAQGARPVPAASSSSPGSVVVRAGIGPIAHCADAAARRHRVGAERAGAEAAQGGQRTGAERAQRPGPKPSRNRPDRRTMLIQRPLKSTFSETTGETHTHDASAELPQRRDRQGPQAAAQVAGAWTRIMDSGVRKVGIPRTCQTVGDLGYCGDRRDSGVS